jgi:hypothetical protein
VSVRLVPPLPDDAAMWKRLLNHLYRCEEDYLFEWLRSVRAEVVMQEKARDEQEGAA